jgi:hypothetical protein
MWLRCLDTCVTQRFSTVHMEVILILILDQRSAKTSSSAILIRILNRILILILILIRG